MSQGFQYCIRSDEGTLAYVGRSGGQISAKILFFRDLNPALRIAHRIENRTKRAHYVFPVRRQPRDLRTNKPLPMTPRDIARAFPDQTATKQPKTTGRRLARDEYTGYLDKGKEPDAIVGNPIAVRRLDEDIWSPNSSDYFTTGDDD